MKTGTLATRLTLAAILLTVLIYFGINVAAYFNDPFTVTVSAEGKQSLIYKHAISTISPARPVDLTAWENGE